jgi:hypothetical protein
MSPNIDTSQEYNQSHTAIMKKAGTATQQMRATGAESPSGSE